MLPIHRQAVDRVLRKRASERNSMDRINKLFNELHQELTSATFRAELKSNQVHSVEQMASLVDGLHHDYAEIMLGNPMVPETHVARIALVPDANRIEHQSEAQSGEAN